MTMKGLKNIEKRLGNIKGKTEIGIQNGLNMILEQSKPYVPVDTGRLRDSGEVTKIPNGYQLKYEARNPKTGYNYAPIQHENLEFNHTVGQAKYLEAPLRKNMKLLKQMIVKEVMGK